MPRKTLRIAATSRSRAEIAAQIVPAFYAHVQMLGFSAVTLSIGSSDSELGGLGVPIAVGQERYHFGFANPVGVAWMALRGRGFYRKKISLRAIGVFPSWDRLIFAVHNDTGIRSLEDIKSEKVPLRISYRKGGRFRVTSFAIGEVLKAYGFTLRDIEKWGGKILHASNPSGRERAEHIKSGYANAVFDEGLKSWGSLALDSGMRFLPIKGAVLRQLERLGLGRGSVSPTWYPELDREIPTLGFSGWLFFCNRDLPSDIAYGMAKAVYLSHLKIQAHCFDQRPMNMGGFCRGGEGGPLTIPLHRGAKKYYLQKGYL